MWPIQPIWQYKKHSKENTTTINCDISIHSQEYFVIEIKPISWTCLDPIFFKNVYPNPILIQKNRKYTAGYPILILSMFTSESRLPRCVQVLTATKTCGSLWCCTVLVDFVWRGSECGAIIGCALESCAGRVRVELAAGRARVEKFFVRVTECWAKARELNQLKNRKTRGCTVLELFASIALRTVGLQQLLHYDVTTHFCVTLAQTLTMRWTSAHFPMLPSYLVRNNSV